MANNRTRPAGIKLRQYQGLWLQIAESEPDKPVSIRCSRAFVATVIQAVKKEKTAANMMRKQLDMPHYGRLEFRREPIDKNFTKITFTLTYNGDQL